MTRQYSLFVTNSAHKVQGTLLCTGIIVPISPGTSSAVQLDGPETALVNGDRRFPVTWKTLAEFLSPSYINDDEWIRRVAASRFDYEVSGAIEAINPPCYLTPDPHCQPRVLEENLELRISTLFETADFQSHIWLQTIGQVVAPFIFGETGIDQSMLRRARQLRPSVGDAFPIVVTGTNERAGVALLQRHISGATFATSLWFPIDDIPVLQGLTLISQQTCEIEGVTGLFQTVLFMKKR